MNDITYLFEFEDGNILKVTNTKEFYCTKLINDPNNDVIIELSDLSIVGKLRKVSIV